MANEKWPIKDPVVTLNYDAVAVDLSRYFRELTLNIKKTTERSDGFGDDGQKNEKILPEHSVALVIRHARLMSAVFAKLAVEYNRDGDTPTEVKFKNAAVSPDNLRFRFAMCIAEIGFGGARGSLAELSVTYQISGFIVMNDGSTDTNL